MLADLFGRPDRRCSLAAANYRARGCMGRPCAGSLGSDSAVERVQRQVSLSRVRMGSVASDLG